MKKMIAITLLLAAVISLCACGSSNSTAVSEPQKPIETPAPTPTPKPVETPPATSSPKYFNVDITKDNFYDYFEFVDIPEHNCFIDKDSTGNIKSIAGYSGFYLKDKFFVANESQCNVQIGVKYDVLVFWQNKGIKVDIENRTYKVTGEPFSTEHHDEMLEGQVYSLSSNTPKSYYIWFPGMGMCSTNLMAEGSDVSTWIIANIELISASGSISLGERAE